MSTPGQPPDQQSHHHLTPGGCPLPPYSHWASPPPMSMPEASALAAPWPFSAAASTPTPSACGPLAFRCDVSIPAHPSSSPHPGPQPDYAHPMAPIPYSRALTTSRSPLHSSSRRLRHRLTAANPPTHRWLEWPRRARGRGGGGATTSKVGFGHIHPLSLSLPTPSGRRTTSYVGGE